jgi:putative hydrolase of the HAD superfamily
VNIIFDLGGVVVTWDPSEFVKNTVEDKQNQQILQTEMVNHPDWIDLDRGILTEGDAVQRGAIRTGLPEFEIQRLLRAVPPFLTPIPDSLKLVKDLKTNGNKLFVLSNLHIASITYLEKNHSFLDLFDGKVISCRINKVKPEPGIYQHLLDFYKLEIDETVFIDDMEINTKAAADLGMKTITFENPDQCREELEKLECL